MLPNSWANIVAIRDEASARSTARESKPLPLDFVIGTGSCAFLFCSLGIETPLLVPLNNTVNFGPYARMSAEGKSNLTLRA